MKYTAYVGFGSNLGHRVLNIVKALKLLTEYPDCELVKVSGLYETAPVGYEKQGYFLNGVVSINTNCEPLVLLQLAKNIEKNIGRVNHLKWGPRIIDLDILWQSGVQVKTKELRIPHPEIFNRAFVLVPLAEINPQFAIAGQNVNDALKNLSDQRITKYMESQQLKIF